MLSWLFYFPFAIDFLKKTYTVSVLADLITLDSWHKKPMFIMIRWTRTQESKPFWPMSHPHIQRNALYGLLLQLQCCSSVASKTFSQSTQSSTESFCTLCTIFTLPFFASKWKWKIIQTQSLDSGDRGGLLLLGRKSWVTMGWRYCFLLHLSLLLLHLHSTTPFCHQWKNYPNNPNKSNNQRHR